jgi:hypothetical protein
MVEAAAIIDDIIQPRRGLKVENGLTLIVDRQPGCNGPFLGPVNRFLGRVHSDDNTALAGHVYRIASMTASEFKGTTRLHPAGGKIVDEVLIRPVDEERTRPGAVGKEVVPPATSSVLQKGIQHSQNAVCAVDQIVFQGFLRQQAVLSRGRGCSLCVSCVSCGQENVAVSLSAFIRDNPWLPLPWPLLLLFMRLLRLLWLLWLLLLLFLWRFWRLGG